MACPMGKGQQNALETLNTTADTCSFHCQGPPPTPPVFAMLNQLTQVSEVYAGASHSPLTQPQKGKELLLGHCRSGAVTAA